MERIAILILRDYQQRAVDSVRRGGRTLIVAPTGSGKTVIGIAAARRIGTRVLWIAHRRELVLQAYMRLLSDGAHAGVIMSGRPREDAPIQVASIQMLRTTRPPADVLVVDEAHHATANGYRAVIADYPTTIGLTATPFRLDGSGLGDLFSSLYVAATPRELIARGVLSSPEVWGGRNPNMRGVRKQHGEFVASDVSRRSILLAGDVVKNWQRLARGKRTVVFAVDVAHSIALRDAFAAEGIRASHLDGKSSIDEREAVLADLRERRIDVLTNCMILTEGWDFPELECAVIARPTQSLCLHLQILGRVMRAAAGKGRPIVLDHAGNHARHGGVDDVREYSLDCGCKKTTIEPSLTTCMQCYAIYRGQACPACGVSKLRHEIEVEHDDQQLQRVERPAKKYVFSVAEDGKNKIVDAHSCTPGERYGVYIFFLKQAENRSYKRGWAAHKYREIYGSWPRKPSIRA